MKISEAEKKAVVVDTDSIPVGAANSPKAYRFTMQQVKQYANDGMATKSEMDATIVRAESLSRQAALAAQQVQRDTEELKRAMQNLPDGQAVSAQVANLQVKKADKEQLNEKMPLGGKDPRAWVGMADQLAPSEKTEQAAYRDEVLPSGRILGFAPELGPSGAGTRDGQIADSVSPVMREVSGVSGGSGQMVDVPTTKNFTSAGVTITVDNEGNYTYNGTASAGESVQKPFGWNSFGENGHRLLLLCSASNNVAKEGFFNTLGYGYFRPNGYITAVKTSALYFVIMVEKGVTYNNVKVHPTMVDLTTLPQLPAPFVASLGPDDAHRVAHALGFLALQRD